jgi:hypothetical protein
MLWLVEPFMPVVADMSRGDWTDMFAADDRVVAAE